MLQRIGLAQSLIQEPKLVVLDEPTAGVDPAGSREIRDLILALKRRGITVLLSSHLLAQVQEICDRVGILAHGVLVREGRVQDLLAIENQTELILENASPEVLAQISALLRQIQHPSRRATPAADHAGEALPRCHPPLRKKMKTADCTDDGDGKKRRRSGKASAKSAVNSFVVKHRPFSFARIAAITGNTFTELVRLKVFYFLLIFALLLIANSLFMARLSFQQEFQVLKDVSLGAMSIFSSLLAIVATAQLLPRDLEDRTIYTILAKPVPRYEYLIGKLAGVLLLLALSILAMSALFLARAFR